MLLPLPDAPPLLDVLPLVAPLEMPDALPLAPPLPAPPPAPDVPPEPAAVPVVAPLEEPDAAPLDPPELLVAPLAPGPVVVSLPQAQSAADNAMMAENSCLFMCIPRKEKRIRAAYHPDLDEVKRSDGVVESVWMSAAFGEP